MRGDKNKRILRILSFSLNWCLFNKSLKNVFKGDEKKFQASSVKIISENESFQPREIIIF